MKAVLETLRLDANGTKIPFTGKSSTWPSKLPGVQERVISQLRQGRITGYALLLQGVKDKGN